MTLVEFILPVIYLFAYMLNFGVFTKKDSTMDKYFTGQDFYTFVFYLSIVVGTYISLCTFVNFQLPREKEINVSSTLKIMNVSSLASDLSFILIQ
jgi:radical SAM superfamily enzyme